MSDDIDAEACELAAAFVRRGFMSRAELERTVLGYGTGPIYFSPLRNSLVIRQGFAAEKRAAEERGRREWIEGVGRRLGLVTEVHRCWVWWGVEGTRWTWWCYRRRCPARGDAPSQPEALAEALAHARSFMPEPPEDEVTAEMSWAAYMALAAGTPALVAEPLAFGEGW